MTEHSDSARGQLLLIEYYQRPFRLFHEVLTRDGYQPQHSHPAREAYWQHVSPDNYAGQSARDLLLRYLAVVEQQIQAIIAKHSMAYWVHLYRRLLPAAIGENTEPLTVLLTRASLEACIQKHAQPTPCDRIGISSDVPQSAILGGLLQAPDFALERGILAARPQLVLTDFGVPQLKEFYDAERLAYEAWRTGALLRMVSKRAPLRVSPDTPFVWDERSPDLAALVKSYDIRSMTPGSMSASAQGVVFPLQLDPCDHTGHCFLPQYNVRQLPVSTFKDLFRYHASATLAVDAIPNFIWAPFALSTYLRIHAPFQQAFRTCHGCTLPAALVALYIFATSITASWKIGAGSNMWHSWQTAYRGPIDTNVLLEELRDARRLACGALGIAEEHVPEEDLLRAFDFWGLANAKRIGIAVNWPGPHALLLPFDSARVFLDLAWARLRLDHLFHGLQVTDQNFKGSALERLVQAGELALPTIPLEASNNERRQIDASFAFGSRLVIVECRASAMSIGYLRGDPQAVNYRNAIVDRALADIDEKAAWLASHPRGRNYDLLRYRDILPVAVTPFIEYIQSHSPRYWITDTIPRVMAPSELRQLLQTNVLAEVVQNVVPIGGASV